MAELRKRRLHEGMGSIDSMLEKTEQDENYKVNGVGHQEGTNSLSCRRLRNDWE